MRQVRAMTLVQDRPLIQRVRFAQTAALAGPTALAFGHIQVPENASTCNNYIMCLLKRFVSIGERFAHA